MQKRYILGDIIFQLNYYEWRENISLSYFNAFPVQKVAGRREPSIIAFKSIHTTFTTSALTKKILYVSFLRVILKSIYQCYVYTKSLLKINPQKSIWKNSDSMLYISFAVVFSCVNSK